MAPLPRRALAVQLGLDTRSNAALGLVLARKRGHSAIAVIVVGS